MLILKLSGLLILIVLVPSKTAVPNLALDSLQEDGQGLDPPAVTLPGSGLNLCTEPYSRRLIQRHPVNIIQEGRILLRFS